MVEMADVVYPGHDGSSGVLIDCIIIFILSSPSLVIVILIASSL